MPDIRRKNIVMLVFSLVFYAWAGPRYLLLLLGMVGIGGGKFGNTFVVGQRFFAAVRCGDKERNRTRRIGRG